MFVAATRGEEGNENCLSYIRRGAWVPAFAGTTVKK
jgi:hypothetical protein